MSEAKKWEGERWALCEIATGQRRSNMNQHDYEVTRRAYVECCKTVCAMCASYETDFLSAVVANTENLDCEALPIRKLIRALDAAHEGGESG